MSNMKLLIVDDHEMFRMGLCALLGQMNEDYEIFEAGTLQEGLDYVDDNADIYLIMVDFNLPDGNGLQLVKHLKETHLHCHILVMSGHESQDLAAEAMIAGANGFLPKSYASKEVKHALSKVMSGEFFIPEKLQRSGKADAASMVGGNLLAVGPNVLDAALDPVIIFENGDTKKLEYINNAATHLGLKKESIGSTFELERYVNFPPLFEFIEDSSRSSFMENEVKTSVFDQTDQWFSVSCSKIDFLGTPSVMFNLHDITELKLREQGLEKTSNTDPLTGLLNRRGFYAKAHDEMERAKRFNQPLCMAMCDLDHFKKLNDTYGHDFGDDVLTLFSDVCGQAFRKQDLLARFGGEEFVILLVNIALPDAKNIVDRMRGNWQRQADTINTNQCQSTVSIGITQMRADDADADVLIKRADELLYVCKASGRNIVKSDTDQ